MDIELSTTRYVLLQKDAPFNRPWLLEASLTYDKEEMHTYKFYYADNNGDSFDAH